MAHCPSCGKEVNKPSRVLKNENVKHLLPVAEFINNPEGFYDTHVRAYEGIKQTTVVGTYVPLGIPDWAVIVELPFHEAFRQTTLEILIGVITLLCIAFIISLIGMYLAKKLSVPIVDLMNTASRIASGEKDVYFSRLFYQAAHEPKELWELPGVQHASGLMQDPQEYIRRLTGFFEKSLNVKEGR